MLVFPELSLTGYELSLLSCNMLHPDDDVLRPIRTLAQQTGMVVSVGAPVAPVDSCTDTLPAIGAIIFLPDGSHMVYCKQHLHPGEDRYASPGAMGCSVFPFSDQRVAHAICADITHAAHPAHAARAGATVYVAGVLESEAGYLVDGPAMQQYAKRHAMGVLMANHGGPSGGYISTGKSAFWAPGGQLVAVAPGVGSWLVIAARTLGPKATRWSPRLVPMA